MATAIDRNKRVVHLTTVHSPRDPRILRKELVTLKEAGYDVHLVAPGEESTTINDVPVTAIPKRDGRIRRVLNHRKVYEAARALAADCYHFHDPELIPLGRVLKRTTGARIIYDVHEDYRWHGKILGPFIRAVEHWCFRWIDHVIVANESLTDIAHSSGASTTWIGNYFKPREDPGNDLETPRELSRGEPLRVIYTGVMGGRGRGLMQLINLARQMSRTNFDGCLDLIGVCYVDRIRQRADEKIRREGLNDVIRRVGWDTFVPWNQLVGYYADAHVGILLGTDHPNQIQKVPTKFYEYIHFGLPILCSDFPVWRSFIEHYQCGAVVPPDDPKKALEVLQRWKRIPERYTSYSNAALKAAEKFCWDKMGRRLVKVYDNLFRVQ